MLLTRGLTGMMPAEAESVDIIDWNVFFLIAATLTVTIILVALLPVKKAGNKSELMPFAGIVIYGFFFIMYDY